MATRNNKAPAAEYASPTDFDLRNTIDEKLGQVHATLDLIYSAMANESKDASLFLETLDPETLVTALSSAMDRLDEAREALERLPCRHQVTDQVGGEARQ